MTTAARDEDEEDGGMSPPALRAVASVAARDSAVVVATFALMFSGVGELSRAAGLDLAPTALMTFFTVAAPAQVAAVQALEAGAWGAAVLAVLVVNLRFTIMAAALLSRLPAAAGRRRLALALTFLSASSFAVVFPRLTTETDPSVRHRPVLYLALVGLFCALGATAGGIAGHAFAAVLPAILGAALAALIPTYFATHIARVWSRRDLIGSAALGALAVPAVEHLWPGAGLLAGGIAAAVAVTLVDGACARRRTGRRTGP